MKKTLLAVTIGVVLLSLLGCALTGKKRQETGATDLSSLPKEKEIFLVIALIKFKPGTDPAELERLYDELMLPILQKTPGFVSAKSYTYSRMSNNSPEMDYVYIEKWESKEAHDASMNAPDGGHYGRIGQTGFYEKLGAAMVENFSFFAEPME